MTPCLHSAQSWLKIDDKTFCEDCRSEIEHVNGTWFANGNEVPIRPSVHRDPEITVKVFDDLFECITKLAEHTLLSGDIVVTADEPPFLGWQSIAEDPAIPVKKWHVHVRSVARSLKEHEDEEQAVTLSLLLKSAAGRRKLDESFPGQRHRPEILPNPT